MINATIHKKEGLTSNTQYRHFLQRNAKSIMQFNENSADQATANHVRTHEKKPVKLSSDLNVFQF